MSTFRSMGCEVVCSTPDDAAVTALFEEQDARFSRFRVGSELNDVNETPVGPALVSEPFAAMLDLALRVARSTGGLVTPAVGAALLAAGYDGDSAELPGDGPPVEPALVPPARLLYLRDRLLVRVVPVVLDLNGVVKGATVDEAIAAAGGGWVSAGGDVATTVPVEVGLPEGGSIELRAGGLATSSVAKRAWRRGGVLQHHLIDPRTGRPAETPWRDVTVVARSCVAADVAAKAALLLGEAGPAWLQRHDLAGRFVDRRGRACTTPRWRATETAAA